MTFILIWLIGARQIYWLLVWECVYTFGMLRQAKLPNYVTLDLVIQSHPSIGLSAERMLLSVPTMEAY